MIKVFYGDDRNRMLKEVKEYLGEGYEVVEGAELEKKDLPTVMFGTSLFTEQRAVMIRDLLTNLEVAEQLESYLETKNKILLLESTLDKRRNVYKVLKDKIEFKEFKLVPKAEVGLVFEIYKTAKRDGQKAVMMAEQIQQQQDPMMFFGLLVTQALGDYKLKQGAKEKRVLLELSKLDMDLKTRSTQFSPWLLIQAFLARLSQI